MNSNKPRSATMAFFQRRLHPLAEGTGGSSGSEDASIEESCRVPFLLMLFAAGSWCCFGTLFSFLASLKFHSPGLLSDCAWMSYGRIKPLATHLWTYGFLVQGAMTILLWMNARICGVGFRHPGYPIAGALMWNLGVLVGGYGIWRGDSTGFEWLEMPRYAIPALFAGFVVLATSGLGAFAHRRTERLYPSQWFILAALLWFPWIYSAATYLLVCQPVRGVLQSAVDWWYVGNFRSVWSGLVCFGVAFYFVPLRAGRGLHSAHSASFVLWVLLLMGSLTGIPAGAPLPAWMAALSSVAGLFVAVAAYAGLRNVNATACGSFREPATEFRLSLWAVRLFALGAVLAAVGGLRGFGAVARFSWFDAGVTTFLVQGGAGLAVWAGVLFLTPRLLGPEFSAASVGWLVRVLVAGVVVVGLSLVMAGWLQATALLDSTRSFMDAHGLGLRAFRLSTLGELLLLLAPMVYMTHFKLAVFRACRTCCWPAVQAAFKPEPAGGKP